VAFILRLYTRAKVVPVHALKLLYSFLALVLEIWCGDRSEVSLATSPKSVF